MRTTTACWCADHDGKPLYDDDYFFVDGTGFECMTCGANVYYTDTEAALCEA